MTRVGRNNKRTSRSDRHSIRPYCTACIRGMVNREPLDEKCPDWKLVIRHTLWDRKSLYASFIVNLPEIESLGLNSCTSAVEQDTS